MYNGVQKPNLNNTGRAFQNEDNDTHFIGVALVGGKVYRTSTWLNEAQNGRKYIRTIYEEEQEITNV